MLVTDQRPREVLVLTRGRLSGAPFLGDSLLICMGPQIILRLISELLSLSPGGVLYGVPWAKIWPFPLPGWSCWSPSVPLTPCCRSEGHFLPG